MKHRHLLCAALALALTIPVPASAFVGHTGDLFRLPAIAMSDVKSIEDAVKSLRPQDLAEFRLWFAEFDTAAWDRQIEQDLAAGKLDGFLAEAQADYQAGPEREL